MTIPRSEHVGSLLRPPELLAARERFARGEIGDEELRHAEDAAVDEVLRRQADCGLDVVTDGEMRRLSFQSQMVEAVDGFGEWDLDAFLWGDWKSDVVGDRSLERPPLAVESRLSRRRFLSAHELAYARGRSDNRLKVTLPSPGLFSQFWDPERSAGAYATLEEYLWDVAAILREEVVELTRLGATYLQLDAPHYPLLLDERWRDFYEARGSVETWLELDNYVIDAAPEGVTFGFHLCRGNQGSRWLVEGSYDALAERIFPRIRAQRLLLEYDDERSGGFEPLQLVPEDKVVVLGLVTTKTPRRETVAELVRAHRGGRRVHSARTARALAAVRLRHVGRRQRALPGRPVGEATDRRRDGGARLGTSPDERRRPRSAYFRWFAFRKAEATACGDFLSIATALFIAMIAGRVSLAETASIVRRNFGPSADASLALTSGTTVCDRSLKISFGSARTVYFDGEASCGSVENTSPTLHFSCRAPRRPRCPPAARTWRS